MVPVYHYDESLQGHATVQTGEREDVHTCIRLLIFEKSRVESQESGVIRASK